MQLYCVVICVCFQYWLIGKDKRHELAVLQFSFRDIIAKTPRLDPWIVWGVHTVWLSLSRWMEGCSGCRIVLDIAPTRCDDSTASRCTHTARRRRLSACWTDDADEFPEEAHGSRDPEITGNDSPVDMAGAERLHGRTATSCRFRRSQRQYVRQPKIGLALALSNRLCGYLIYYFIYLFITTH